MNVQFHHHLSRLFLVGLSLTLGCGSPKETDENGATADMGSTSADMMVNDPDSDTTSDTGTSDTSASPDEGNQTDATAPGLPAFAAYVPMELTGQHATEFPTSGEANSLAITSLAVDGETVTYEISAKVEAEFMALGAGPSPGLVTYTDADTGNSATVDGDTMTLELADQGQGAISLTVDFAAGTFSLTSTGVPGVETFTTTGSFSKTGDEVAITSTDATIELSQSGEMLKAVYCFATTAGCTIPAL
jgi:hypothetical protein